MMSLLPHDDMYVYYYNFLPWPEFKSPIKKKSDLYDSKFKMTEIGAPEWLNW